MNTLRLTKTSPKLRIIDVYGKYIDLITCLEYPYILPTEILKTPRYGCINAHYSLLPKYRGRHPIQWAMINGDALGVSIHFMTEETDAGDVIQQVRVDYTINDGYSKVYNKCYGLAYALLNQIERRIARGDSIKGEEQDCTKATYTPRRLPIDSHIRHVSSCEVSDLEATCRFINAMSDPMPNAYIDDEKGRLYFKGAYYEPKE